MDEPDNLGPTLLASDKSSASEINAERKNSGHLPLRICLVGEVGRDAATFQLAQKFGADIVVTETGSELLPDKSHENVFVVDDFYSPTFDALHKECQRILGPPALKAYAEQGDDLPHNKRPIFSLSMQGLVICFTGFRNKEKVIRLMTRIHHMGGSIRKDMVSKVTHLVAKGCGGGKYQYAVAFRVPILAESWVHAHWDAGLGGPPVQQTEHKLRPFSGARVCFHGFSAEERAHMADVLVENGGEEAEPGTPATHLVCDSQDTFALLPGHAPSSSTPLAASPAVAPPPAASPVRRLRPTHLSFADTPPANHGAASRCEATPPANHGTPVRCEATPPANQGTPCRNGATPFTNQSAASLMNIGVTSHIEGIHHLGGGQIEATPITNHQADIQIEATPTTNRSAASGIEATPLRTMSEEEAELERSASPAAPEGGGGRVAEGAWFKTPASGGRRLSLLRRNPLRKSVSGAEGAGSAGGRSRRLRLSMRVFRGRGRDPSPAPAAAEEEVAAPPTPVMDSAPPPAAAVPATPAPAGAPPPAVVRAEWFWVSVQNEGCADERDYLFEDRTWDRVGSPLAAGTPSSARARKRKRLCDAARYSQSPAAHKRRSSVSDAAMLSVSGSFLDATDPDVRLAAGSGGDEVEGGKALTARQMVFLELVQTETNYVSILETIMTMFKGALEKMKPAEGPLLNATELRIIFGNVPPIFELHAAMLDELRAAALSWREDAAIGHILLRYMGDLVRAYPPFVNFLEASREQLARCDAEKPRFHAFLKICQAQPECGRQTLVELLIRPVQRLPSISLLLNDILKQTSPSNPDHACLERALVGIKEVMTHINEDKRKTESQLAMFDIFHEIDNCPPELLSSQRCLVSRVEVVEVGGGLSNRGDVLMLFLFTDMMEVCKRRGGRGGQGGMGLRSPTAPRGGTGGGGGKPYKHVRLIPLPHIKRVIDVHDSQDSRRTFALDCRSSQELKGRTFALALSDEAGEKRAFLRTLCRQIANAVYKADAESLLFALDASQLDVSLHDITALGKAFKFASRTRQKVGRAFSFNKTPSKLKRAVSSMLGSPMVHPSSTLTPATQLAQMRLASCSNIHELGVAKPSSAQAPMSVQPTRRNIPGTQSLNAAALRRM